MCIEFDNKINPYFVSLQKIIHAQMGIIVEFDCLLAHCSLGKNKIKGKNYAESAFTR